MTYQAFVFTGQGKSPGAALQAALDQYVAWFAAQVGGGVDGDPPLTFELRPDGDVMTTRLAPHYYRNPDRVPAWAWECSIGVVATMRLPARPVESADV